MKVELRYTAKIELNHEGLGVVLLALDRMSREDTSIPGIVAAAVAAELRPRDNNWPGDNFEEALRFKFLGLQREEDDDDEETARQILRERP